MAVSNLKDRFLQVGGGYIAEAVGITEVDRRSKVGKIEGWGTLGFGFRILLQGCRAEDFWRIKVETFRDSKGRVWG